jgi:hypothetical protein
MMMEFRDEVQKYQLFMAPKFSTSSCFRVGHASKLCVTRCITAWESRWVKIVDGSLHYELELRQLLGWFSIAENSVNLQQQDG